MKKARLWLSIALNLPYQLLVALGLNVSFPLLALWWGSSSPWWTALAGLAGWLGMFTTWVGLAKNELKNIGQATANLHEARRLVGDDQGDPGAELVMKEMRFLAVSQQGFTGFDCVADAGKLRGDFRLWRCKVSLSPLDEVEHRALQASLELRRQGLEVLKQHADRPELVGGRPDAPSFFLVGFAFLTLDGQVPQQDNTPANVIFRTVEAALGSSSGVFGEQRQLCAVYIPPGEGSPPGAAYYGWAKVNPEDTNQPRLVSCAFWPQAGCAEKKIDAVMVSKAAAAELEQRVRVLFDAPGVVLSPLFNVQRDDSAWAPAEVLPRA